MEYFAIGCKAKDLMEKVEKYYKRLEEIGHTEKMQKSCLYYFGQNNKSSHLRRTGSQRQLTSVVINDYRSILQHVVTLVTANRPAFDVRATNTDYKSQTQTILGEQILDYYLREKDLENLLKKACRYGVRYSEGFIGLDWDSKLGRVYEVDEEGRTIHEGDIKYTVYNPLQVIRDVDNESEPDWMITVAKVNKYELAAKFEEHEEYILKLEYDKSLFKQREIDALLRTDREIDTDMIPVFTLFHRKSAVLPEGRHCMFVKDKVLMGGVLPFKDIPIYRVAPDTLDGTCLGHTGAFDLLSIQEASDKLYSAVLSNNLTFSKQVIQTRRDSDFNVSDIAEGLMLIESESDISAVNLTKSAPETYKLLEIFQSKGQELSGINEVIRGVPSPNLRSGNALVLVAAQAITYNSDIQASYNMLTEGVGTATIRVLQSYAKIPKFAAIVGKYKKAYMKEFIGEDLGLIDRVTVEQQGSVMRTTAGKVELAQNLLANGLIKRPDQYLMVIETGKLDPLIEPEQAEILLIKNENEMMSEGQLPPVIAIDNHDLHIIEHKAVLSNPESRRVPEVVKATLEHIKQHVDLKKTTDPALLSLLGIQPVAKQQPPQGNKQQPIDQEVMAPPGPVKLDNMPSYPEGPEGADPMTQDALNELKNLNGGE